MRSFVAVVGLSRHTRNHNDLEEKNEKDRDTYLFIGVCAVTLDMCFSRIKDMQSMSRGLGVSHMLSNNNVVFFMT